MKKVFAWYNSHGFLILLVVMLVLPTMIEVLDRNMFVKSLCIGNHTLQGWIFMIAGGLFLFSILIFAPLYRKFGVTHTRTIKKGKHFPMRIHFPIIANVHRVFTIARIFNFSESCLYDFTDEDEHDKNKLFGVSFAIWPRIRTKSWERTKIESGKTILTWFRFLNFVVIKPIHWSSARLCWNTVNKENKIDIWPYIYDKGVRVSNFKSIGMCSIGEDYEFKIDIDKIINVVGFTKSDRLSGNRITTNYNIKDFGIFYLYLDLYFGGNKTAPHIITIEEKA